MSDSDDPQNRDPLGGSASSESGDEGEEHGAVDEADLGEPIAELALLDAEVNGTLVRAVRRSIHRRMLASQTFDLTAMGLAETFRSYMDLAVHAWLDAKKPRGQ